MGSLKCDGLSVGSPVEIELNAGWLLQIDNQTSPTTYTIYHGKKSMSFNSQTMTCLCNRAYGIRLVKGRRQMKLPPEVLHSLVDYAAVIQWVDAQADILGTTPPTIKNEPMTGQVNSQEDA
jgi:hypothetical protein